MKTNTFKYIFFAIVIFLIGLAVFILYKDGKKTNKIIEGVRLDVDINKEINIGICKFDTLNPILSNNRDIQYIDKLIFKPLIDINSDFSIKNELAKEFSKINNITYIVKLKDDVYWHDGEKFTAKDVIFTLNKLKDNNINSIYKENVKDIKRIEQIDDYTIKITLDKETDFFEYMMCIPILASHSYNQVDLTSKTDIPVGTGEFKIAKADNNTIYLENSEFVDVLKVMKIKLILMESTNDLYDALSKNDIDLIVTDNIEYEDYIGGVGYNVKKYSNRKFDYLIMNNKNEILSNKEIRKAINYAIDKNKINYSVYKNKYNVCDFPLEYGSYLNEIYDKSEEGWNLKNKLLTKNRRILVLKLLVNNENKKRVEVAENIKEQLKEVGITINIISVNNYKFNNYIKNNNYDMILTGNVVSTSPILETYFGDNNLSNYTNDKLRDLLNDIKKIGNQEDKLKEKYYEIKEIYKDEMPFISLYFNSVFVLSSKKIKGSFNGNWYNIYYNIDNWYKTK